MSGLASQEILLGSGDTPYPQWIGNQYASTTFAAADGTTVKNLLTGAPGYYITQLGFQFDSNVSQASAGMISINFTDSVFGSIAVFRLWVPANANGPITPTNNRVANDGPFVWNNKNGGSILQCSLSSALTGVGIIRVFVRYGLTNYVG